MFFICVFYICFFCPVSIYVLVICWDSIYAPRKRCVALKVTHSEPNVFAVFSDWFKYWFHRLRSVFDMWWICWMLCSYTVHFFNDWMSNKSAITSETQLYYTVHMLLLVTLWNPQMRGVYVKTTTKKTQSSFCRVWIFINRRCIHL